MIAVNHQKQEFSDRLERIRTGKHLRVAGSKDADAMGAVPLQDLRGLKKQKVGLTFAGKLRKAVLAFAVGFASMLAGRVMAFHYAGIDVAANDYIGLAVLFGGDIGIAIGLSLMLMAILGLNKTPFLQLELMGFLLVMFAEGIIAQKVPVVWSALFSAEYTTQVIDSQQDLGIGFEALTSGARSG